MGQTFDFRTLIAYHFFALMMIALFGCSKASIASPSSVIKTARDGPATLALVGYNYTTNYIDSFSVDGQGGGNINLSSPNSGGGGIVCCALYQPNSTPKTVTVRWQSDACYYPEPSSYSSETYETLHAFYKEKKVVVTQKSSEKPEYMEVHFYPDGSIHVIVTDEISMPLLSLQKERNGVSKFPRCPNDKKPSE